MKLLLGLTVAMIAAGHPPGASDSTARASAGEPLRIVTSGAVGLNRLGPMRLERRPRQSPPYHPRWTLEFAIKTFGEPQSLRSRPASQDAGCTARWPHLGLVLEFSHVHLLPEGPETVCRRPDSPTSARSASAAPTRADAS